MIKRNFEVECDFGGKVQWSPAVIQLPSQWSTLKKGLRAWLCIWGVAILCLPIPVIHLVFPPLGFIFGPILGILVFIRSRKIIDSIQAHIQCPECSKVIRLIVHQVTLPAYDTCPYCKAGYCIYSIRLPSV